MLLSNGCATRQAVVIDSQSSIVRIGKGVRGPVYIQDEEGRWIAGGVITLPEGWYAGPLPNK